MKRFYLLCFLFWAGSAVADPAVKLDAYASEVRGRVVAKIREGLNQEGRTTELSGVVTLASDGRFFLESGGAIKVLCPGALPRVGDVVVVSGATKQPILFLLFRLQPTD